MPGVMIRTSTPRFAAASAVLRRVLTALLAALPEMRRQKDR